MMDNSLEIAKSKAVCRLLKQSFEETQNPVYLFLAYQEYRKAGHQIGEWILTYFDSVATQIFDEIRERENGVDPGNRRAGEFLNDIMYKGHGDIFNRFIDNQKKLKCCIRYAELKAHDPERPDSSKNNGVRDQIERELNINEKTIQGWVKGQKGAFDEIKEWAEQRQKEQDALKRFDEIKVNGPERPIFDLLEQVERETGIKRLKLNLLLNLRDYNNAKTAT